MAPDDGFTTLLLLGGVGVVGYRAYKGQWPWEAEWFPGGKPQKGEMEVTSIEFPESAYAGEPFDVRATVENTGDTEATRTVRFTYNETEAGKSDVTIPVGMERTVTLSMSIPQPGTYTICAKVPHEESASGACVTAEVK